MYGQAAHELQGRPARAEKSGMRNAIFQVQFCFANVELYAAAPTPCTS